MNAPKEVHILVHQVGHIIDPDCWCEPHIDRNGDVLFIKHNDTTDELHDSVIFHRSVILDWITNTLNKDKIKKEK